VADVPSGLSHTTHRQINYIFSKFKQPPSPNSLSNEYTDTYMHISSLRCNAGLCFTDFTKTLPRHRATMDGVWIGNRIYSTLWYSAWLHCYTHTHTHTHYCRRSQLHCRCLATTFKDRRSPSSGVPKCPRPQLPASNSNPTGYLTNSLQVKFKAKVTLRLAIFFKNFRSFSFFCNRNRLYQRFVQSILAFKHSRDVTALCDALC
jgi:hypothetical protein